MEKLKKILVFFVTIFIANVFLVAVLNYIVFPLWIKTKKEVFLPDYRGKEYKDAVIDLKERGFKVEVKFVPNPLYMSGIIFDQEPSGGKDVRAGKKVLLFVSNMKYFIVPDYKGKTVDYFRTLNAIVKFVKQHSDSVPYNFIIKTDPLPGETLYPGDTLYVYVSTGAKRLRLPDLRGRYVKNALKILKSYGVEKVEVIGKGDKVIKQFPDAGVEVDRRKDLIMLITEE